MRKVCSLLLLFSLMMTLLSGCAKSKNLDYQFSAPKEGETIAILHTTMGDITLRFFEEEAPKAVGNFLEMAQRGYYDGCEFFRVIDDFMIQTGDPAGDGTTFESASGGVYEDEIVEYLSPFYGAVCLANKGAYTGTNGSQFFIVTSTDKDTSLAEALNETVEKAERVPVEKLDKYKEVGGAMWLDSQIGTLYETSYSTYTAGAHTVFAQVISGMDVALEIAALPTYTKTEENAAMLEDKTQKKVLEKKPKTPVLIESIEITQYHAN